MPCTSAWASDGWWGSLSDTDQRTVANAMYSVTGRPAPYAEQDAEGQQAASLLIDKGAETGGEAGEVLGQAALDACRGPSSFHAPARSFAILGRAAERTPEGALLLVGSYLIYRGNRYVTMKMTTVERGVWYYDARAGRWEHRFERQTAEQRATRIL